MFVEIEVEIDQADAEALDNLHPTTPGPAHDIEVQRFVEAAVGEYLVGVYKAWGMAGWEAA